MNKGPDAPGQPQSEAAKAEATSSISLHASPKKPAAQKPQNTMIRWLSTSIEWKSTENPAFFVTKDHFRTGAGQQVLSKAFGGALTAI